MIVWKRRLKLFFSGAISLLVIFTIFIVASPAEAAAAKCFQAGAEGTVSSTPCSQLVGLPLPAPASGPAGASAFNDDKCYLKNQAGTAYSTAGAGSARCRSWQNGRVPGAASEDRDDDSTASFGEVCELDQSKFGIPTWYKYLQGQYDPAGNCRLMTQFSTARLNSLLSIGLAIVEILLFAAGIVAVVFIVVGGFRYVLSQGKPEETAKAQESIINSVIGLVIAILAATLVRFIASRLSR